MIERENIICPQGNKSPYISVIIPTYRHAWELVVSPKTNWDLER